MSSIDLQPLAPGFWRSTSFIDRIKQWVGLAPSTTQLLTLQIHNLAKGIDQSDDIQESKNPRATIKLVVTYFEEHWDSKLESVLKGLFEKAIPQVQTKILDTFIEITLSTGSLKMLAVIEKIVPLEFFKQQSNIEDVPALAKMESAAIPKSIREKAHLILNGESPWIPNPYALFKTILTFPQKVEIYLIKSLMTAIHNSIYTESITIKMFKENFDFYRLLIKTSSFILTTFLAFFSRYQKIASLLAIIVMTSFIYSTFVMHTLDFSEVPEHIDKKKYFTNVNIEIQEKNIKPEKTEEYRRLITSYFNSLSVHKEFPPLLLVSDDDSGITNLIRSLAWESKNQSRSPIYGMTLFNVKSIALDQEKRKNLDQTLQNLEQIKSRVILHVDARQAKSSEKITYFLKELKKKKIRYILTLKSELFKSHYQTFNFNVINLQKPPIDPQMVELRLRKEVSKADVEMVEVEGVVYKPLSESLEEEESSPRDGSEAIQQVIKEHQYWIPTAIKNQLQALKIKKESLVLNARENLRKDPKWSQQAEGKKNLKDIGDLNTQIETLEKNKTKQDSELQKIVALRKLEFPLYIEYYLRTQLLASTPADSPAQKTLQTSYLLLQHFVRPKLVSLVKKKITKFEAKYNEKIPLKIDGSSLSLDSVSEQMGSITV